jgi:iron-sulfur cluster assembly protein
MTLDTITGPDQPPALPPVGLKAAISITPKAVERIRYLLAQKQPQPEALLVSITSKGCSGHSYDIQYLDHLADAPKFADIVRDQDVAVVIDPKASLFIIGATLDYIETPLKSGFDFHNPNETARCGCGESFSV